MAKSSNENFIKINRKILYWEWYNDVPVKTLFIHCLIKANWKDGVFQGKTIKRGQFVTSLSHLALETGLTVKQVRIALEKLKTTGEIRANSEYRKYSIITVLNYDRYQTQGHTEGHTEGHSKGNNRRRSTTYSNKKDKEKGLPAEGESESDDTTEMTDEEWLAEIRSEGDGSVSI